MSRIAMSPAAAGLLRALIARADASRDRILLTGAQSTDWRSLTFAGERHLLEVRVIGAAAAEIVDRMKNGLEDCEFSIPGVVVADVGVAGTIDRAPDGSISVTIEALTVSDD